MCTSNGSLSYSSKTFTVTLFCLPPTIIWLIFLSTFPLPILLPLQLFENNMSCVMSFRKCFYMMMKAKIDIYVQKFLVISVGKGYGSQWFHNLFLDVYHKKLRVRFVTFLQNCKSLISILLQNILRHKNVLKIFVMLQNWVLMTGIENNIHYLKLCKHCYLYPNLNF